ncbi:MAG TPA: sodium/glutamate symporter [Tepidisphaeraceae bacterium]|jgi:ESS family glutamate:Na+ symporter|nr:sodium/glutamate symporter [Tepidisphaeraceae bacterium]
MNHPAMHAILLAAGLLAIGLLLRMRLRLLKWLYIPAAVVAGILGFALAQVFVNTAFAAQAPGVAAWGQSVLAEWQSWPATLIAVVFAGLLIERPRNAGSLASAARRGLRSGVLAWVIILGQLLIGLGVYALAVRPVNPDIPPTFGQLLEISWAGGHGSAAGMGAIYSAEGFPQGRDLAFFAATVGLIYGVISGLAFVNLAIRRGWVGQQKDQKTHDSGSELAVPQMDPDAAPTATPIPPAVAEPLVVAVIALAAAVAVGLGLKLAFLAIVGLVVNADDPIIRNQPIDYADNVPLFLFTLLGGWIVRRFAELTGTARYVDAVAIQRLVGVAMEFLIIAGLATMRMESISQFGWPLVLMLVLAAAWSAFCLLVLARALLPRAYWFELGLLNYGFSTANTPQGLMLLRIVDPDLRTRAAADYAIAAPLSAPFIGGGIVTFLVMPLLLNRIGLAPVMIVVSCILLALLALGRALARSRDE